MTNAEYVEKYPERFKDELDKWLFIEFGILGGCCSSIEELKYNVAREVAKKAIEIAREEVIEKAIGWIEEINNNHHIIRYSDSCEPPISELTEWFKNYMEGE